MIPEIGHFALMLAFILAMLQATFPLVGAQKNIPLWISFAKPLAYGQAFFVFLSFFTLVYAFASNDFTVAYVANNSNTELPLAYRLTAIWGAHEGSLLLWITVLAFWMVVIAFSGRRLPADSLARVLSIMAWISIGFLLFMLSTSDPFLRLLPDSPMQGRDLNPLLQDPGLVGHPPMLYMGYVGFSVTFAFAIAALLEGKFDSAWARWMRPWTIAAWCFLTLGITLGSWWAYRVLGWGGWWFWDPVENASFLPWLVGTALIHSLIVVEKRGVFKSWTVLLAILAFSLSLMGTFLVRSGILTSVHSFAVDPARGAYILKFLSIAIGGSLLLYSFRAHSLKSFAKFHLFSREALLFSNNIFLVVMMATILLGTLYPMIIQILGYGKLSVGAPYFNTVFIPLSVPLLFLIGIGPQCYWQETSILFIVKRLWWILLLSALLALTLPYIDVMPAKAGIQASNNFVILGLLLSLWVILSSLQHFYIRLQATKKGWQGLQLLPRSFYSMFFAHIGLAVSVIGITLTTHYSLERDLQISVGDTAIIGPYHFTFVSTEKNQGPNYSAIAGHFRIEKANKIVANLQPEKRIFNQDGMSVSKPDIYATLFNDLYLTLGEQRKSNVWALRVYYKPFVRWIWFGGLLMVLGGIIELIDRKKLILVSSSKPIAYENS